MIKTATKRPIEVIAMCYDEMTNVKDLIEFMQAQTNEKISYNSDLKSIFIEKDRGTIELRLNNWLIWEVNTCDQFWAIDKDIFFKTYEPSNYDKDIHLLKHFKKKQITVEYVHFKDLESSTISTILTFLNDPELYNSYNISKIKLEKLIPIKTLEGFENLNLDEFLIKGIDGEFYPVNPKSFSQVYIPNKNN